MRPPMRIPRPTLHDLLFRPAVGCVWGGEEGRNGGGGCRGGGDYTEKTLSRASFPDSSGKAIEKFEFFGGSGRGSLRSFIGESENGAFLVKLFVTRLI